mmetsp:Transcript_8242/g.25660  ORF Transcript_8242/g.25660 Transcript_8242/m.25660 type:complete len:101 (+) Transcript_8242:308-610(+)
MQHTAIVALSRQTTIAACAANNPNDSLRLRILTAIAHPLWFLFPLNRLLSQILKSAALPSFFDASQLRSREPRSITRAYIKTESQCGILIAAGGRHGTVT